MSNKKNKDDPLRQVFQEAVSKSTHKLPSIFSIIGSQIALALLCQPEAKRHFDKKVLLEFDVIFAWGRIVRQLAPILEQSLSEHRVLLAVGTENSDCSS